MRVLGNESTADPTAIEKEVRAQMEERQMAHDDRNLSRKLTPAERKEKKVKPRDCGCLASLPACPHLHLQPGTAST